MPRACIFEVIGAIIALVWGTISFLVAESAYSMVCSQLYKVTEGSCGEQLRIIFDSIIGVVMFCAVVQLVCASMMIHGVRKNDHCLMCPFLIKNAIFVGLFIIIGCVLVAFLCVVNFLAMLLAAYWYGALIFMWTYFLLTVRAYYYEVKRGKADDHHRLVENSELEISAINNL